MTKNSTSRYTTFRFENKIWKIQFYYYIIHYKKNETKGDKKIMSGITQKYAMLSFVHVCKEMPSMMSHFESDFDAIVECTYAQKYGCNESSLKDYSLYKIKDGKIVNNISWYYEHQLTLLPEQDTEKALKMISEYTIYKTNRI
jgi:hypothetical protein